MKQIQQVREFHERFEIPILDKPSIPQNRVDLRYSILIEEVNELFDACKENNIVEVADAIVDCLYVLIGTAHEFGIAHLIEDLFDEVHRSNMSKLDKEGNVIRREDGKILKSELYFKPDIASIIYEYNK